MPRLLRTPASSWLVLSVLFLAVACGGGGSANDLTDDGTGDPDATPPTDDDGGSGGGDPGGGTTPGTLQLRALVSGDMSGVTYASTWTAQTQAEYDALWSAHRPIGTHVQPPVDFGTEVVVAVFLGQRASSGYGVDLVAAAPQGDGAVVLWDETYPGVNCPPGLPVITYAYTLAAMTRVEGAVTYTGGLRPIPCP